MKRTKICPKCGSTNIHFSEGGAGGSGSGNIIPFGNYTWQAVPVDRYICCDCGYIEEWLRPEHLDKIENSKRHI